jgi:hypothetical protein
MRTQTLALDATRITILVQQPLRLQFPMIVSFFAFSVEEHFGFMKKIYHKGTEINFNSFSRPTKSGLW